MMRDMRKAANELFGKERYEEAVEAYNQIINHGLGSCFEKDDAVKIRGMVSRKDLNGQTGSMIEFLKEKKRWSVKIDSIGSTVAVKKENLESLSKDKPDPEQLNDQFDLHLVLSNRSAAFAQLQQYGSAEKDALEVIRMKPTWLKGYMRLGDARVANYDAAGALEAVRTGEEAVAPSDQVHLQRIKIQALSGLCLYRRRRW